MDSQTTIPDTVVPELWFDCVHQQGGRDYLVSEPWQTFPGRMQAWCQDRQVWFRVSKRELPANLPDPTRYWVQGFLTGNTPRQPDADDGDPALDRWRQLAEEFLATGLWPSDTDDHRVGQWRQDADVLRDIGLALADTALPAVEVRLPPALAHKAVTAWERDDLDGPAYETLVQRAWRHRAATLALIGLAVRERGRREPDAVRVELDAQLVVEAIQSAEA